MTVEVLGKGGLDELGKRWAELDFDSRTEPFINTVALARWKDSLHLGELFQQFGLLCIVGSR